MMHPKIKEKRDLLDFARGEFLRQCGMNPKDDLEQCLESTGFKLKSLFANVPFPEGYERLVDDYEQRTDKKEIEDYALIPAWRVPALMEKIIEKELLPFAFYVKQ